MNADNAVPSPSKRGSLPPIDGLVTLFSEGAHGQKMVVDAIERATAAGAFKVAANALLADLLCGTALRAAREFDVITAMRAARAAVYLGARPDGAVAIAAHFAEGLQRGDGSFISETQLTERFRDCPYAAMIARTVTGLQCLWTSAEVRAPGFRLTAIPAPRKSPAKAVARPPSRRAH